MAEKKKSRWTDDTMMLVSRDVRAKLKIKAAKLGISVKDFLKKVSEEK